MNNERKNEKRYFADWVDSTRNSKTSSFFISIITIIITTVISYKIDITKYYYTPNASKLPLYILAFLYGYYRYCYVMAIFIIVGFIAYQISKAHRKRESEKETAEKNDSSDVN